MYINNYFLSVLTHILIYCYLIPSFYINYKKKYKKKIEKIEKIRKNKKNYKIRKIIIIIHHEIQNDITKVKLEQHHH